MSRNLPYSRQALRNLFRAWLTRNRWPLTGVSLLVLVGLQAGKDEALMRGDLHRLTIWIVGAVVVLGSLYYAFVRRTIKNAS